MVTSDILLHLITHLQRDTTVVHGRRTVLEYARTSTGARLALLFVLERQTLVLLEQCGRRTQHHQRRPYSSSSVSNEGRLDAKNIPLHGLFGTALDTRGLIYIPHAFTDPRSLNEERFWISRSGQVIMGAIRTGWQDQSCERQGVLVLCFDSTDDPQQSYGNRSAIDEGNLLVCTALLAAYLSKTGEKRSERKQSLPSTLQQPGHFQAIDSNEERIQRLSELYEVKLKIAIDQERNRIARDIHDGIAQHVAHVLYKLEFIQRIFEKQPVLAQRELSRSYEILEDSLNDLRHDISSLIPVQLEEQEFETALQALLDEYVANEPELKLTYDKHDVTLLPQSLQVTIFRFIQEALNNVRKHAQATQVLIRIHILPHLLLAEVSDNGVGFDIEQIMLSANMQTVQHIGLRAMREHIQQAGGNWEIQSMLGEGTIVKARIPLATPTVVLTSREREVLRLLIEGLTNRAIAEELSVSTETVKSHVHHIMQKMRVNDRTQAAVMATRQRWI